jgi:hypothetical protein
MDSLDELLEGQEVVTTGLKVEVVEEVSAQFPG